MLRPPRAAHLPARPPDRRILAVLVDEELGGAVDVEVRDHALLTDLLLGQVIPRGPRPIAQQKIIMQTMNTT
jgi:hypothetical protein